jgi:hypothetical protein
MPRLTNVLVVDLFLVSVPPPGRRAATRPFWQPRRRGRPIDRAHDVGEPVSDGTRRSGLSEPYRHASANA